MCASTCMHATSGLLFFFFNDTATTEIYTLSLHDALPISGHESMPLIPKFSTAKAFDVSLPVRDLAWRVASRTTDRKSTRLNSSHGYTPYGALCLKKKKTPFRFSLVPHQSMLHSAARIH